MEFEGKSDPEAGTPLVNGAAAGTNENNTTGGSSDNTLELALSRAISCNGNRLAFSKWKLGRG